MRRRKQNSESSLELLLDTMTNAFGGVLFLAILLSVQLKDRVFSQSERPDTERNVELIELAGHRDVLKIRLEGIVQQLQDAESARFANMPKDNLDPVQLAKLHSLKNDYESLLAQRTNLNRAINDESQAIEQKRQEAERRLAELGQVEIDSGKIVELLTELTSKRAELNSETKRRTISGKLPVLRYQPQLQRFDMVLRHGKVYFPMVDGRINQEDFEERPADFPGVRKLVARPNKGVPIHRFVANPAMPAISPLHNSLTMFVWQNTFDDFQEVKEIIVKKGFKYRTELMEDSDEVTIGGGGGGSRPVQ